MRKIIRRFLIFTALAIMPEISKATIIDNIGEQKTLVIVFKFSDSTQFPMGTIQNPDPTAFFRNLVFTEASNYYYETSYGQTWITGDVAGPFTLLMTKAQCSRSGTRTEANQLATAAGFNLANYKRIIYAGPDSGATGCTGGTNSGSLAGAPYTVNLFSSQNYSLRFIAHEFGHTFGFNHSMALDCGTEIYGSNCTQISYGSPLDIMGSGSRTLFSAFQRESVGWITANTQQRIQEVTASGIYSIDNLENTAPGIKALKVQYGIEPFSNTPKYYYVEYRQPVGYDAELAGVGYLTNGVAISEGGPNHFSFLLDMNPNTNTDHFNDIMDSALSVGNTFNNPEAGISIKLLSLNGTSAEIQVNIANPCIRNSPTLSISPSSQSTSTAGSTLNYTLTLTNKDSVNCASSIFNLNKVVPSDLNGVLSVSSVSLTPNNSQVVNLSVTSSPATMAGTYSFSVNAQNTSSGKSANVNGNYVLQSKKGGGRPRK